MRRGRYIWLSVTLLVLCASFTIALLVSQVLPRLNASEHTAEMCAALQRFDAIRDGIFDSGDTSRLPEIFVQRWIDEEAESVRVYALEGRVSGGLKRYISCQATFYTPTKAEVDATTWTWPILYDRQTGQPKVIDDPSVKNHVREDRFRTVFVKEQGNWKYYDEEVYGWSFLTAERPAP